MSETLTETQLRELCAQTAARADEILGNLNDLKISFPGIDEKGALLGSLLYRVCKATDWVERGRGVEPVEHGKDYDLACLYEIYEALTQGGETPINYGWVKVIKEELLDKVLPTDSGGSEESSG